DLYTLSDNERTLLYYRLHPDIAAKHLLGSRLNWYQRISVRQTWASPFSLLVWGRRAGKTYTNAVTAVLYALLYPRKRIMILGPSKRQGDYMFDEIQAMVSKSEYLQASLKKNVARQPAESRAEFTNGSRIVSIPIGPSGSKIRGAGANLVVLDEYAQFDESIVNLVVRPFLAMKVEGQENKLIITSSAYYKWNHLYDLYCDYRKLIAEGAKNVYISEYDYRDVLLDKNSAITPDLSQIEASRKATTIADFEMEYFRKFPDSIENFFPTKLIDECTPKPPRYEEIDIEKKSDTGFYIMGVDCARAKGGSNFCALVGKVFNGEFHVVHLVALNGRPYQEMISRIRDLLFRFPIELIYMDRGGGGETLKDYLAEDWINPSTMQKMLPLLDIDDKETEGKVGLRMLRMVNITAPVHNSLYINLKAEMENGRVKFPINLRRDMDPEIELLGQNVIAMKKELAVIEAKPKGAYLHFSAPNRFNTDRAMALSLAVSAFRGETRPELQEKDDYSDLATGMWVGN
ncbi:MAG: terminase large subunit domain-containing protein, partial [Candidatus Hodarchaeales archaeon]